MLEFDGLHKSYGDHHVLEGVGFTVAPGSMFGFCGANGAGKTTTIKILTGLIAPSAGEAFLFGERAPSPSADARALTARMMMFWQAPERAQRSAR